MRVSQHNIFSRIKDSENYFLVNVLTQNADILNPSDAAKYQSLVNGINVDKSFQEELEEKGYLMDEADETRLFRSKYLDFIDSREKEDVQLFFVPNYSCNFACSYCYQDEYAPPKQAVSKKLIDAFFQYINTEFAARRKYITVFGGEPLLGNSQQREIVQYLIQKANEADLELCFVTNGYTLADYIEILKLGKIREIQVTLDGTEQVHNARRFLKGGQGTFLEVIKGIDACLNAHINVNLRMVLDKENIADIPALARFTIAKGWTQHSHFKTQIGRNYELHHCQSAADKLFTRISMYEKLYELTLQYPEIAQFYKPSYSISKFLFENGEMPEPLFDSCPACKTEWAFDYTGRIYPCTATVGKEDEALGTFFPQVSKNTDSVEQWEMRDITAIPDCAKCNVQLACGGGCGSVAKNASKKVCSPDCRPVKALLELGFSAYFERNLSTT